jgi:hypothetical protein
MMSSMRLGTMHLVGRVVDSQPSVGKLAMLVGEGGFGTEVVGLDMVGLGDKGC